jgi:WhiB family redox-sensing transcriptional regulator
MTTTWTHADEMRRRRREFEKIEAVWAREHRCEEEWESRAHCLGMGLGEHPKIDFFPIGTGKEFKAKVMDAKAVCRRCPVQIQCLEYALRTDRRDGIWGGMTENERRNKLRRDKR